jgi:serine/threonine protein kinase
MKDDDCIVLDRIAEAIADGTPVDWESEGRSRTHLQGTLGRMKNVERIGALHRSLRGVLFDSSRGGNGQSVQPTASPPIRGPRDAQPVPRKWGSLIIEDSVGAGSFGEVFRAHDPALQTDVALKLHWPDSGRNDDVRKRFLQEARQLAKVQHPNVLKVYGADEHAGRMGIWTELVEGSNLDQFVSKNGLLGPEEAIHIGSSLSKALAAVHGAGLIHRDIKPGNVMRADGGRYVLLDFSSVIDRSLLAFEGGAISGTPSYMAPEVLLGEEASRASDVYSLGVLLYKLVSGHLPVEARSLDELRDKHARAERVRLLDRRADLPEAFVEIVERAIEPDPARRYQTAGELEHALLRAATGHWQVPPVPRRWIYAAVAAALFVAAVTPWVVYWFLTASSTDFEVSALMQREAGRTPRELSSTDELLQTGSLVRAGDELFLTVEGSHAMHVYVFAADTAGNGYLLFPSEEMELSNPVEANVVHRLPDRDRTWPISPEGREEHFLIVASVEPLGELERTLNSWPRPGDTPSSKPGEESADERLRLRGITGLSDPREAEPRIAEVLDLVAKETTQHGGVWFRQYRLHKSDSGG